MADTAPKFERVYVERSKPSGEHEINTILTICSMIPVLKYTLDHNIPELLNDSPRSVEEIASVTNAQPVYLQRLLRALSAIGFYSYDVQSKLWSNSKSSGLFLSDYKVLAPHYENPFIRPLRKVMHKVLEVDATAFEICGVPPPDFNNPQFAETFHVFMHAATKIYMERLKGHLGLPGYNSIIDIGGGTGALLEYIRAENPNAKLANFDLPAVEWASLQKLAAANMSDVEYIAGSFFDSIPAGFDVYLLKNVLHDWSDQNGITILKNIRKVISDNGLLVILDSYLTNEDNKGRYPKVDDIRMMTYLNGECKSEKQYLDMLRESGFRLKKVKYDSERISILYFVPE